MRISEVWWYKKSSVSTFQRTCRQQGGEDDSLLGQLLPWFPLRHVVHVISVMAAGCCYCHIIVVVVVVAFFVSAMNEVGERFTPQTLCYWGNENATSERRGISWFGNVSSWVTFAKLTISAKLYTDKCGFPRISHINNNKEKKEIYIYKTNNNYIYKKIIVTYNNRKNQ